MNIAIYEMKTYTPQGKYSHGFYKTKSRMIKAKEKYNQKYGAHLKAEVIVHLADGSTLKGLCLA